MSSFLVPGSLIEWLCCWRWQIRLSISVAASDVHRYSPLPQQCAGTMHGRLGQTSKVGDDSASRRGIKSVRLSSRLQGFKGDSEDVLVSVIVSVGSGFVLRCSLRRGESLR